MLDKRKVFIFEQVLNVADVPRDKIINTKNLHLLFNKTVAKMTP